MKLFKILFVLLFCYSFCEAAKDIRDTGIVFVYDRTGNIWTGKPIKLCISIISDTKYIYYIIENPEEKLFRDIGKTIIFDGKAKVITNEDTKQLQNFIIIKEYKYK